MKNLVWMRQLFKPFFFCTSIVNDYKNIPKLHSTWGEYKRLRTSKITKSFFGGKSTLIRVRCLLSLIRMKYNYFVNSSTFFYFFFSVLRIIRSMAVCSQLRTLSFHFCFCDLKSFIITISRKDMRTYLNKLTFLHWSRIQYSAEQRQRLWHH